MSEDHRREAVSVMDLREHQQRAIRARWSKPENVQKRIDALKAHVRKVVDTLPPLTPEQKAELAALLPGADQVEGNPIEQAARLIGTLERRTAQLEAIDQELRAFGIEYPLGRAGVADVCAMASGRLVELEQVRAERDAARAEVEQLRTELAAREVEQR